MAPRSSPIALADAEVLVLGPDGAKLAELRLAGERVSVGRLAAANDIALDPDPQRLVTRVAHCTFEREGGSWFVVDGGSVNGTFLKRGDALEQVPGRSLLQDGDVVCVLATLAEDGERSYFELVFQGASDSQATRAAPLRAAQPAVRCLRYDPTQARLLVVRGLETHEITIRAQAHRLVGYMAERNAAIGGAPALCTHDELMRAVWADEPMHSRTELAKLVWELRRQLEPFGAADLIESERRRGYRIRTCPADE
jgi:DNA-binding winged helix-turn-helix (wHTH) protein